MNVLVSFFCFFICVAFFVTKPFPKEIDNQLFFIERGINLNNWLEVKTLDSLTLDTMCTRTKIVFLKELGFDHVRIPVSEESLFDDDLNFRENVIAVLDDRIEYCIKLGVKVVLDLHVTRDHHFGKDGSPLFFNEKSKAHFFEIWEKLQNMLMRYPVDFLAYECLNEPAAPKDSHDAWNELVFKWINFIREKEPERMLFIGSNRGNQLWTFKYLNLPKTDKNLILTFHFYKPNVLTHYKAHWSSARYYEGPVVYPGSTIPQDQFEKMPDSLKKKYAYAKKNFDINTMRLEIEKAVVVAKKYGLRLNVGEFGCRRTVPDSVRYSWFNDLVHVLRENNISYTLWGMNGAGFGIRKSSKDLDSLMLQLILPKKE
ncbi:cellulase family glycosylhydrolase [uncultured Fibrobacter sp.]|uniref:glycoside hydrolase family 5 protein n=1 Tax=uncultured Fibrobacter sp. TaxID=261512 RepID=UPI00262ADD50|nr:cellulase family glycosylhydrolase [uncultured Fibrobacter sp.]